MSELPVPRPSTATGPSTDPDDPTEYRPRHKLLAQLGFRPHVGGGSVVVQPSPVHPLIREQFPESVAPPPAYVLASTRVRLGDPSNPVAGGVRGGILVPLCRRLRAEMTPEQLSAELPGLVHAAELAVAHDCSLVVVCSRAAAAQDIPGHLRRLLGERLLAVDLERVGPGWLPVLHSRSLRVNCQRRNDVGSKRNLGLAVAAVLKWDHILFLDDDIRPFDGDDWTLDAAGLSRAIAALEATDSMAAIGWTLEKFEDNSVAGHGRRAVGLAQQIFVGGGALLVRFSPGVPFFPDIYNEDWLFLIALAARSASYQTAVARAGRVRQRQYQPFRPLRAVSEEPGEVIGECLMNLLEDHGPGYRQVMSYRFWRESLRHRRHLLKRIRLLALRKAAEAEGTPRESDLLAVAGCMSAAQKANEELRPEDLMSFVRSWHDDHAVFAGHLTGLAGRPMSRTELGGALLRPAPVVAWSRSRRLPSRSGAVSM